MGSLAVRVWLWLWVTGLSAQRIFREDRLALLSGTLRTFQVASCDGEQLQLRCPSATTVSIQLVRYGRLASKPDLCGQASDMQRFNYSDCMDRNALKVVIAACAGKRQCQLYTSSETFGVDPCPGISKFVEVLYKCRPSEFRSRVVCQGRKRTIYCGQDRVAIYSASFGTRKEGSVHCPQPPGVTLTDCQASFTSEKMISQCQGKPSCELDADPNIFSRACPPDHNMYLTTTYTCVPREILRDKYAREVDEDYQQNMTEAPPVDQQASAEMEARDVPPSDENSRERLILYLTLGFTGCLLLCLSFIVGRLCHRWRTRRSAKEARPEPPPPGFTSDLSRVDADLDLDLGPTVLSSGRLTPPYAGQVSFSAPRPQLELGRFGSPFGDSSRAGEEPTYRGSLRGSEEPAYRGSLRGSEEPAYRGSLRGSEEPPYRSNLRASEEPTYRSNLRASEEPTYRSNLRASEEPTYRGSLRGSEEPPYRSSLRRSEEPGHRSDPRGSEEPPYRSSVRSSGSRSPCRTVPNVYYYG